MKLKVKDMDISTGGILIAILNANDAAKLDLHTEDRVLLKKGSKKAIVVVDIAESVKSVPDGSIGMFEETLKTLGVHNEETVHIYLSEKPKSVSHIKKKLRGEELSKKEIYEIVQDIVENHLTDIELTYFVSANYTKGMTWKETVNLTKAMVDTGEKLILKGKYIVDKHSIGGVPGNRTTPIVVPIVVAGGLTCPKTSSRSITSPAGTADTMEVLCNVDYPIKDVKRIVKKTGGCIIWGGAVNLAPADDKIIRVENPLSIDPEGQLLASIMAKKGSVSASHVLIDIPVGKTAKISDMREAKHLASEFKKIGAQIGMKVDVVVTDGSQPIGRGLGPALEARDIFYVLKNDERAPLDLKKKGIMLAGLIFEMCGKCLKGRGYEKAKHILESGDACKKFIEILKAQDGKIFDPDDIEIGEYSFDYKAKKRGKVISIDNKTLSKITRIAGAPKDKGAGAYVHKFLGDKVKKGEKLLTIYAESKKKLEYAVNILKKVDGYKIK